MRKTITREEVKALVDSGHVVCGYPRKKMICVDGGKYYDADSSLAKLANELSRARLTRG